jgi:hypothetical protein
MGRISQWSLKGSIDYYRPKSHWLSLRALDLAMKVDDKKLAECFGLALWGLLVGICYRDLAIARRQAEKPFRSSRLPACRG